LFKVIYLFFDNLIFNYFDFKFHLQVNEFIRRFDLRNEKVVTRLQFDRGLDQLKCDLTRTEVNSLMDHFTAFQR
jgi:hypothetical protein